MAFITLHCYDITDTRFQTCYDITFYEKEISKFKENPENLIKEHLELKNVVINTDNIKYITDFTMQFKVESYPNTFYKKFSTIHLNDNDKIEVAETQEEILEIINNANRPVVGNPNLLQRY